MTSDQSIRQLISDLVAQERSLRERIAAQGANAGEEREQLRATETELDQCWDLLRQRQAAREFGNNPDDAKVRPASVVENYLD